MSEPRATLHVRVVGDVQGVGFRRHAERAALAAHCDGWVRNRGDGSVEVCAVGSPAAIGSLRAQLQAGPRHGRVDRLVDVGPGDADDGPTDVATGTGFSVRGSAP